MKTETYSVAPSEDILADVWRLKEENAAEYGFDIEAIARAARKHQDSHPERVVRRILPESNAEPGEPQSHR